MAIELNQIVGNLIPDEPVIITKIQGLGNKVSITYTGVNTKKASTRVIGKDEFDKLQVLSSEGRFNFTGNPLKFTLFTEAERINSAYQFDPLFAVNCSIVDPLPHQVEAVYKSLLPLPKIRFLLADDTGAGKTIMTGLLLKEMMMRGLVERILIITPGGLTKQWQEDEMGLKFNIPFKLVNRAIFSSDPNIFSNSERLISSIDFIRGDDVLNVLRETRWDMIIVDEAHKLTAFDYGTKRYEAKRYKAIHELSHLCEHLLLLTATPHRGRKDTFKNLLQLLDEDIFASDSLVTQRIKEIADKGANKFFIRRLKEEMKDWNGKKLFKDRHTKTVMYELTPEEKKLYDAVTDYLTTKREEAKKESNIHVSLALMVMQRRLTSSIFAIKNTLHNRYRALKGLLDEINRNPDLWKQRQKLEAILTSPEDYDEMDDGEREGFEAILADPKKFRLFTTAKSPREIAEETNEVKYLVEIADNLYNQNQEEQKFRKLRELLTSQGVLERNEKMVIFTEHKDTLVYLEQRLKNNGYSVTTIHGGKDVDERREAQAQFASKDFQILIATDAAGEGINLQFCRLLINWDIPWNPNRLEQRMGRIHRYGQKQDVMVFNMVAQNTREGNVLQKLLMKLDAIREQMGDDRVYDVISDIFENVDLDDIVNSVFNGNSTDFDNKIDSDLTEDNIKRKIQEQKNKLAHSLVNYKDAKRLKENSDEKRLQPIYIRLFFEKAFKFLGGKFTEVRKSIYRIDELPEVLSATLKSDYNISADIKQILFCFDKQIFLDYQNVSDLGKGKVHYINPGNPVFDSIVKVIKNSCREDVLKGTVLISPDDKEEYLAFYVKSQIMDERPSKKDGSLADEKLALVFKTDKGQVGQTSPAKFIDLFPPNEFAKTFPPPAIADSQEIVEWSFANITEPQLKDTDEKVKADVEIRREYLETAFTQIIVDLTGELEELQAKFLLGDVKVQEKIKLKQSRIEELKGKKIKRLENLNLMLKLSLKAPEILGCAYVIPLSKVEYENHYGMSRDDEVEMIAMQEVMKFERDNGWNPEDVSKFNEGYDIRSINSEDIKRYIEVKGRSVIGGVMLSENEMNRLSQLGECAWLYVVVNCANKPELFRIQNPGRKLKYEVKTKGIQYFIPQNEWKTNAEDK